MSTITREQAQKIIEAADEVITALAGTNEDVHPESDNMLRLWDDLNDRHAPPEVVRDLARIALAALEAEPVAYIFKHPAGRLFWSLTDESNRGQSDVMPVYTAPPAPVSVPEWTNEQCLEFLSIAFRHAEIKGDLELDDIRLGMKMVNGCRAAMLQGADGNSPVIPDGWVACSERMPEDEQEVITHNIFGYRHVSFFDEHSGHFFDRLDGSPVDCVEHVLVSHWMPLPAAPQQEVK